MQALYEFLLCVARAGERVAMTFCHYCRTTVLPALLTYCGAGPTNVFTAGSGIYSGGTKVLHEAHDTVFSEVQKYRFGLIPHLAAAAIQVGQILLARLIELNQKADAHLLPLGLLRRDVLSWQIHAPVVSQVLPAKESWANRTPGLVRIINSLAMRGYSRAPAA